MAIAEHILEMDQRGWMVIHPLRCPGNLLECPVTQICRQMTAPPATGRFWAAAEAVNSQYKLVIGERVPPEIEGTSRRTGYRFVPDKKRPS